MRVRIASRFRPFSHTAGAACLIPGTRLIVRAHPTQIEVEGQEPTPLTHKGPIKNFTLHQDLEKGVVKVTGTSAEGPFCHTITSPKRSFSPAPERLSFGCAKQLNWDHTRRRKDPKEILPVWYALSQVTPPHPTPTAPWDLATLMQYWEANFSDILVPQETPHLGITPTPADIITEGGRQIRALFLDTTRGIHFLPRLPKELPCGRMTGVMITPTLRADFLWSKSKLRQVVFHATEPQTLDLHPSGALRSFRLRTAPRDRGTRTPFGPLTIERRLLLDNFTTESVAR